MKTTLECEVCAQGIDEPIIELICSVETLLSICEIYVTPNIQGFLLIFSLHTTIRRF